MRPSSLDHLQSIYSNCRRTLGTNTWGRVLAALDKTLTPQAFPDALRSLNNRMALPDFISDLARLEWAWHQAHEDKTALHPPRDTITVNPSLNLVPVSWKNLTSLFGMEQGKELLLPEPAPQHVMVWRHPKTGKVQMDEANDSDLLALKIIVEQIDPRQAAAAGGVGVKGIHAVLDRAIGQGYLLTPGSRIQRKASAPHPSTDADASFLTADSFTLQWHITQACDLHCKHCYDRSDRASMQFDTATAILDDFYGFCRQMHVDGHVTFTGGNPLLYPRFTDLYKAASNLGFGIAILGNPTPIDQIERVCEVAMPSYFQISLEGLAGYDDYIRGPGHFQRSLTFLDQLRQLGIYTMVMLTLSRDNMDQVLPLGRLLKDRVDTFNFNRLSTVGEGAQLAMPSKKDFERFLRAYVAESEQNPILGLKDNLIDIVLKEKNTAPFGGCTGYGCGAAFNFVALLPDGEVHACRKFPSPIGNILRSPLVDIYHSEPAQCYRNGSEACRGCEHSAVCRGCLAISYSHGLDVFKEKDPFCFV